MNSFELNKILGALLGTCLVLLAVHIASGRDLHAAGAGKARLRDRGQAGAAGASAAASASRPRKCRSKRCSPAPRSQHGTQIAKQCETCHNFGKGQGNKIGPDLYGVVGRPVASEAGFNYSAALKAKGGTWTFDALNTWLTNPRADVPGTAMTFAGLPSEKQRADVIAYLNSNSDNPLPLPKAARPRPRRTGNAAAASPQAAARRTRQPPLRLRAATRGRAGERLRLPAPARRRPRLEPR